MEDAVMRMIAEVEARKNAEGSEHTELTLRQTVRDTLNADPIFMDLGALVDAYAEITPPSNSRIHYSHPDNPILGYASTLLDVHYMLVKDPQRWCNAELPEDEVCELYHRWFHYMAQAARVVKDWGRADGKTHSKRNLWFDNYLLTSDDDDRWLYYMKMSRCTFLCISNRLQMLSWRDHPISRPEVPIPAQLGATLYHLVHGADYHSISEVFEIEPSAVQETLEKCVDDLLRALGEYLMWPRAKNLLNVISGFNEHWGLANCQGVLGTVRVNVTPPKFHGSVVHVVALQGVCDSSGAFLNVFCAHPGSLIDCDILRSSSFYLEANRGSILKPYKVQQRGELAARPYVLAGQDYEPLPWLLISGTESSDSDGSDASDFPDRTMMARSCINRAFKDLMKDFLCLRTGVLCELQNAPAFIHVCCILHNLLYLKEDRPVRPSPTQRLSPSSSDYQSNDESSDDWESEDEVEDDEHDVKFVPASARADGEAIPCA
ncbi:nuclease HARBI1 [Marchantia polymorpha subsp. ruderalis]|uniref:DDE Tnp4 domain-containing protein n=1 Tax=Marchantia polymorpha subsp. ruderalis TaxID=1480154 RepID=A0AAF6BRP6_MARPO|nr:hypothetical protein Mp_6g13590 [Marchantia polymorpha subsp. ruderalis]